MADAIVTPNGTHGALVTMDPRLVQLMAIGLLDGEPESEPEAIPRLDRRSFQIMATGNLDDPVAQIAPALAASSDAGRQQLPHLGRP
jgi:hypothetical protein